MIPSDKHLSDDLLSAKLDSQLDAILEQQVEEHLAHCTACLAAYRSLQATRTALSGMRVSTLPRDFRLPETTPTHGRPAAYMLARHMAVARFISVALIVGGIVFFLGGLSGLAFSQASHPLAASNAIAPVSNACQTCSFGRSGATDPRHTPTPITPGAVAGPEGTPVATTPGPVAIPVATPTIVSTPLPPATPPQDVSLAITSTGVGVLLLIGGLVWMRRSQR